jgi:putative membrane protein
MPATHAVDAMRAAMMGVYQNDIWISLAILAVFGVAFIAFGLLLRRPAQALTRAYLKKVDASKLMNA